MASIVLAHSGPHYPSHLDIYTKCRRRYLLKVIERRRVDEPFSPPLEKGRVAHDVLKLCADQLMGMPASCPADLRSLVASRLPREPYASEQAWRYDLEEIVNWVKYALAYLDPEATILGAELFLNRKYRGDADCAGFTAGAVLDLVLLRRDEQEAPFIEIVDYKTGKCGWENPLAPVIARFVVKPLITRHMPAGFFGRVVYTELYLAERVPRQLDLELSRCLERWEEVKRLVSAIKAEELFPPSPSPQNCRFCPYAGNGCDAAMPEDDDGELW